MDKEENTSVNVATGYQESETLDQQTTLSPRAAPQLKQ